MQSAKDKAKEIPTPEVLEVPSYRTDYLPTFREKQIYTRTSAPSPHAHPASNACLQALRLGDCLVRAAAEFSEARVLKSVVEPSRGQRRQQSWTGYACRQKLSAESASL